MMSIFLELSGSPPFSSERKINMKLRDQILNANYTFFPGLFKNVSEQAQDLIVKLLKSNPDERIGSDEILEHPWLQVDTENISC